jgi:Domain of unknown function (DUF397)
MDVTGATWRTSSYTGSGGGNCVEVGNHAQDRRVLIRDTKNRRGPVLAFNPQSWRNFTADQGSAPIALGSAASDVPDHDRLFGDLVEHPVPADP